MFTGEMIRQANFLLTLGKAWGGRSLAKPGGPTAQPHESRKATEQKRQRSR